MGSSSSLPASNHRSVEIRSPRLRLVMAILLGLNAALQLAEADRAQWSRGIAIFIAVGAVVTGVGYLLNRVSVTADVVRVRSYFVTREYSSTDALRAFDDGQRLYVDDWRVKLPFPVSATMMAEAVQRARGHLPRDIGKPRFGSGRLIDSQASAVSNQSTITDIAKKSAQRR